MGRRRAAAAPPPRSRAGDERAVPEGLRTDHGEGVGDHVTDAEGGTRNAEQNWECRAANDLLVLFRLPRFAFRVSGGVER